MSGARVLDSSQAADVLGDVIDGEDKEFKSIDELWEVAKQAC